MWNFRGIYTANLVGTKGKMWKTLRTGDRFPVDELATEKEHLSVTLRSIGDGVISTDAEGRIRWRHLPARGWSIRIDHGGRRSHREDLDLVAGAGPRWPYLAGADDCGSEGDRSIAALRRRGRGIPCRACSLWTRTC